MVGWWHWGGDKGGMGMMGTMVGWWHWGGDVGMMALGW